MVVEPKLQKKGNPNNMELPLYSIDKFKSYFKTPSSLPTFMKAATALSRCSVSCAAES